MMSSVPHATGPVTYHINETYGGDSQVMKFYCTTNETTYGAHWSDFRPRTGVHKGTGYQSNFRPQIYYRPRLDEVDNPEMGRLVAKNYKTVHQRDYVPYTRSDGSDAGFGIGNTRLPTFFFDQAHMRMTEKEARNPFIDTRIKSAPCNIGPRHRPLLHKLQRKDPIELENHHHGPSSFSTQYKTKYVKPEFGPLDVSRQSLGPKEDTGFTNNTKMVDPVQHIPMSAHRGDKPGWMTNKPTGPTTYTIEYRPYAVPTGQEVLPNVCPQANRDSGCVQGNKTDPKVIPNDLSPFEPPEKPPVNKSDLLGRTKIGDKEDSGYSTNARPDWIHSRDDPRRFITHYMTKFYDPTSQGQDREGHLNFAVQPPMENAITKSTSLHSHENDHNVLKYLRRMEPYQARSLVARERLPTDPKNIVF